MKPVAATASVLFVVVATAHLTRFILAWPVSVNAMPIPVWPSAVAFLVTSVMSILLWRESRR